MKRTGSMLMITLLVACLVKCGKAEPADFRQYVESIRQKGMTESAWSDLVTIASIRIGYVTVSFPKDTESGQYENSYRSNRCPNPDATPEQQRAFQEKSDSEVAREIARLRPFIDGDSSGFVSTGEAHDFRQMYEFGLKVSEIIKQEGSDPETVAKAMGYSREILMKWVTSYKSFSQGLKALGGQVVPEVPL